MFNFFFKQFELKYAILKCKEDTKECKYLPLFPFLVPQAHVDSFFI